MGIRIVTDSTSYIAEEELSKYGIDVVPLSVCLGDWTFQEGTVSNKEYYEKLKKSNLFPTTSQPPAGDFVEVFERYPREDSIICILISANLSGTVQSAQMAAQLMPDRDIEIIDSKSTAIGLAYMVLKAAEMAAQGYSKGEILAEVLKIRSQVKLLFLVDDLEYLIRGGRLGKTAGKIADMLQVKPILHVVDGQIQLFAKVRIKSRALKQMMSDFEIKLNEGLIKEVALLHIDNIEEVMELKKMISGYFSGKIIISEPGPVIGSHVGPGTLGIAYY